MRKTSKTLKSLILTVSMLVGCSQPPTTIQKVIPPTSVGLNSKAGAVVTIQLPKLSIVDKIQSGLILHPEKIGMKKMTGDVEVYYNLELKLDDSSFDSLGNKLPMDHERAQSRYFQVIDSLEKDGYVLTDPGADLKVLSSTVTYCNLTVIPRVTSHVVIGKSSYDNIEAYLDCTVYRGGEIVGGSFGLQQYLGYEGDWDIEKTIGEISAKAQALSEVELVTDIKAGEKSNLPITWTLRYKGRDSTYADMVIAANGALLYRPLTVTINNRVQEVEWEDTVKGDKKLLLHLPLKSGESTTISVVGSPLSSGEEGTVSIASFEVLGGSKYPQDMRERQQNLFGGDGDSTSIPLVLVATETSGLEKMRENSVKFVENLNKVFSPMGKKYRLANLLTIKSREFLNITSHPENYPDLFHVQGSTIPSITMFLIGTDTFTPQDKVNFSDKMGYSTLWYEKDPYDVSKFTKKPYVVVSAMDKMNPLIDPEEIQVSSHELAHSFGVQDAYRYKATDATGVESDFHDYYPTGYSEDWAMDPMVHLDPDLTVDTLRFSSLNMAIISRTPVEDFNRDYAAFFAGMYAKQTKLTVLDTQLKPVEGADVSVYCVRKACWSCDDVVMRGTVKYDGVPYHPEALASLKTDKDGAVTFDSPTSQFDVKQNSATGCGVEVAKINYQGNRTNKIVSGLDVSTAYVVGGKYTYDTTVSIDTGLK